MIFKAIKFYFLPQLLFVYPHIIIMNFVQVLPRASYVMPVDRKFMVGFFM